MERICPFLATSDDGRTVVDGFDRSHVCRAGAGHEAVDRAQQLAYCLDTNHVGCERFTRALDERGPVSWPAPSPDAVIVQTRLILPPAMARHALPVGGLTSRSRRWLVGGAVATIGVAAVATGVAGTMGGFGAGAAASSTATPSPSVRADTTPAEVPSADVSPTPSQVPTPEPTAAPTPSPAASSAPPPTAAPTPEQPRTYVVQPGDTLNGIAIRFGTTVQAIQEANGLGASDVILAGQVLIIP